MSKTQSQIEALAHLHELLGRFVVHCGLGDIEVLPRARAEQVCETYREQVFDVAYALAEARKAVAASGVTLKTEWCEYGHLPLTRVELYDRETAAIRRQKVDCTWARAAQLDIKAMVDNLAAGAGAAAPKGKRRGPRISTNMSLDAAIRHAVHIDGLTYAEAARRFGISEREARLAGDRQRQREKRLSSD